jgi:hypothetical protein
MMSLIGADSRTVANHFVKTRMGDPPGVSRQGRGSPLIDKGRSLVSINATFATLAPVGAQVRHQGAGVCGSKIKRGARRVARRVQTRSLRDGR